MEKTGFLTSNNRSDAENLASRFSPTSKLYELKTGEQELNLLVSTDVLSEGQNLQDAGVLINFDLHWNPVRMIQRNGRVNRLGSVFDEVSVFNMKPESELDGYLRLIQRLEGKINIIRNTIGTDTPVLKEAENPIEYTDSVSDIYSHDMQKRIKALEDAEKASDYLLSEDEFIMDLKKFYSDPELSEEYKKQIFEISGGKWGLLPNDGQTRPAVIGLSALVSEADSEEVIGYQFVELDAQAETVKAISSLQALEFLRTTSSDSHRVTDRGNVDREKAKNLIERGSMAYTAVEETGSLVGQEKELLRILYVLQYSEDEINLVRDAFKTKDVLFKRAIDTLKRQVMAKSKKGDNFQKETRALLAKAREIAKFSKEKKEAPIGDSNLVLAYLNWKMNV
jgi:superfamily II DNA/RNA helicase